MTQFFFFFFSSRIFLTGCIDILRVRDLHDFDCLDFVGIADWSIYILLLCFFLLVHLLLNNLWDFAEERITR